MESPTHVMVPYQYGPELFNTEGVCFSQLQKVGKKSLQRHTKHYIKKEGKRRKKLGTLKVMVLLGAKLKLKP